MHDKSDDALFEIPDDDAGVPVVMAPVGRSKVFRAYDRDQSFLMPPSLDDWLPQHHTEQSSARDSHNRWTNYRDPVKVTAEATVLANERQSSFPLPGNHVCSSVLQRGCPRGPAIDRIVDALAKSSDRFEIVAVDDGSSDATWDMVRNASAHDDRVRGIQLSRNFGKEGAISAGIMASRGSAVIVLDGDLQHPPEYIPQMVKLWREGYELVSAVKTNRPDQGRARRLVSRGFNQSFSKLTGVGLEDATDFRLMDRAVVDAFLSLPEVNMFFRGATTWLGFSSTTIPITVAPRPGETKTKWHLGRLLRMGINALLSFTSMPLHIVTIIGALYLVFGVLLGMQTLWRWGTGGAITGFTTVILLVLATGGLTLIGLGIVGEYIARIFDEVKGRPRYVVRERTGEQSDQSEGESDGCIK